MVGCLGIGGHPSSSRSVYPNTLNARGFSDSPEHEVRAAAHLSWIKNREIRTCPQTNAIRNTANGTIKAIGSAIPKLYKKFLAGMTNSWPTKIGSAITPITAKNPGIDPTKRHFPALATWLSRQNSANNKVANPA